MKIANIQVAEVFAGYPQPFRRQLLSLRKMILEVAKGLPELGGIEETLKWGEPSYLPKKKNVGTTVRIHYLKSKPGQFGIYFNCNTSLIRRFKRRYGSLFKYEGKRALIFEEGDKLPAKEIKDCIALALTYHRHKKR